jgi:hypothetical protein
MNPGDYSVLVTSLSIAAYGVYQYVKREKEQRMLLQNVAERDIAGHYAAVVMTKPAPWRLLTLALVELLLIAEGIWLVSTRSKIMNAGDVINLVVITYVMLALPGALGVLKPALWRLITLCFIQVLLVVSVIWLIHVGSRIYYAGDVAYGIAFCFVILFFTLLPVFLRDIRAYRNK